MLVKSDAVTHVIVKDAASRPEHGLGCESPCDSEPWSYVVPITEIRLPLIPQAGAEHEIGTHTKIVERVKPEVELVASGQRIAGRECELAGGGARHTNPPV